MYKFQNALLLYNVNAGEEGADEKLSAVVPELAKFIKELTIIRPDDQMEARAICRRAGRYELFIVMGGDGTVHQCLDVIAQLEERPLLAILPGGTSNDFSRTVGMPQDLQKAAESLATGDIVETDIGKAGNQHFVNFWSIGLAALTSQNVDSGQKKSFGPLSYMASALRTLKEAETFSYTVETQDGQLKGEAIALFVMNGTSLATAPIPVADISPYDGKLDLLIFKATNAAALLELLSLRREGANSDQLKTIDYLQADSLRIEADALKQVDMDGELYEFLTGEIRVLARHLRLLVPSGQED
ncbi:putative lipid kinase BmrU [Sporosarcina sp. NCCP-2716]|uniref:diacylglycerol/lipid kinase family protein n=1 Tax=Sporosarcina sp. NCCP-2716 TaxID=2943679 RepID=UPI00203AAAE1|nr:diacylglycerol kinase family protein [Sporosarcina sp. NCCP-2716]GKV69293.1 putative lipid kinase BmrU [Sporosarcina sp. NCCP-2716]